MRSFIGCSILIGVVCACSSSSPDFTADPNAAPATSPTPSAANTPSTVITVGATTGVKPGAQVGYSITALAPNSYRIEWTGDSAVTGQGYHFFAGSMWASGKITGVVPGCANSACPLESGTDTLSPVTSNGTNPEVTWNTDASIGFDGFDFTVDSGEVFFDVTVDNVRRPDLVYLPSGGQIVSPTTSPFGVTSQ